MSMSNRFLSLAAVVAVSVFSFVGFARAGDEAAHHRAAQAPALLDDAHRVVGDVANAGHDEQHGEADEDQTDEHGKRQGHGFLPALGATAVQVGRVQADPAWLSPRASWLAPLG